MPESTGVYRVQRFGLGGGLRDDEAFPSWHAARDHLASIFAEQIEDNAGDDGCDHCHAAATMAQARLSSLAPGQDLAEVDIDGSDYRLIWSPSAAHATDGATTKEAIRG